MIEVKYRGGLGDRLFQYCFGRILAERFGYALEANPIPGFPGTQTVVAGNRFISPMAVWSGNSARDSLTELALAGQGVLEAPGARVVLHGQFQKYEYFSGHTAAIRTDWLALNSRPVRRPSGELVICLGKDRALGAAEIRRVVELVAPKSFFIVMERPNDILLEQVADLNPTAVNNGPMANFRFIMSFANIALSQDITYWWAAFLSDAERIYFPPCRRGNWAPSPSVEAPELQVPEPRYVYGWSSETAQS